ncbi:AraC family transcriptional regulator [Epilithonimonas vandammei]|uniref:AraC family transcriptional regulator n=1 Tax=Epilithonimonas vandammei TaxID=2487072 RepID=A0A3G8ZEE5_9FLAO|nr:AraC family transcriptional regulator [Epilithonimonas vandammei]AZI55563.1 AraC family transcriptional regulator [Epilithonimonas vandammei]
MDIINFPEHLFDNNYTETPDLQIANYEAYKHVSKNKINLNKNVFSFLLDGQKDIHFSNDIVSIDHTQALLLASGNFLTTELVGANSYSCLLFFFSQKNINDFLLKYGHLFSPKDFNKAATSSPYFLIQKDNFIIHFITSIQQIYGLNQTISQKILELKFEEIMLYLADKYGQSFFVCLHSLLINERELSFKMVIEKNLYTSLNIDEVAFLCNMSLSTFKRKFTQLYQESPGKWFQLKRLNKAKKLLLNNEATPSEIYMDFGYDSLSNFSTAFKNEFGYSPKNMMKT